MQPFYQPWNQPWNDISNASYHVMQPINFDSLSLFEPPQLAYQMVAETEAKLTDSTNLNRQDNVSNLKDNHKEKQPQKRGRKPLPRDEISIITANF
jgi:hypothetical protein